MCVRHCFSTIDGLNGPYVRWWGQEFAEGDLKKNILECHTWDMNL